MLAPLDEAEVATQYAFRLQRIQNRFPFLRFAPANLELYTRGLGDRAQDLRDIVLIGSPDQWHALHAIDAINAGADVYLQKPISRDVLERYLATNR